MIRKELEEMRKNKPEYFHYEYRDYKFTLIHAVIFTLILAVLSMIPPVILLFLISAPEKMKILLQLISQQLWIYVQ